MKVRLSFDETSAKGQTADREHRAPASPGLCCRLAAVPVGDGSHPVGQQASVAHSLVPSRPGRALGRSGQSFGISCYAGCFGATSAFAQPAASRAARSGRAVPAPWSAISRASRSRPWRSQRQQRTSRWSSRPTSSPSVTAPLAPILGSDRIILRAGRPAHIRADPEPHDRTRMPHAKTPVTGSAELNAMIERVASDILALLADGVPRRKPAIVAALAGRHDRQDVVHALIRLAVTGRVGEAGGKYALAAVDEA